MRYLPCLVLALAVGCGRRDEDTSNGTDRAPPPGPAPERQSGPSGKTFVNDFKMEFVLVPKGTLWSPFGATEIKQDFYLGVHEVTQEQWQAVLGNNPSYYSAAGGGASKLQGIPPEELKRFPVERVSWQDARDFVARLNQKARFGGWRYRLPTQTEWEYACRAGASSQEKSFPYHLKSGPSQQLTVQQVNFGSPILPGRKKMPGSLGRPCRVGSYEPNRLGLYDMHGNVWEWCEELYPGGRTDRARRGGSYGSDAEECKAGARNWFGSANRSADQGVRVALVPAR